MSCRSIPFVFASLMLAVACGGAGGGGGSGADGGDGSGDRDGDGVPDSEDQCPDTPGNNDDVGETYGCPETGELPDPPPPESGVVYLGSFVTDVENNGGLYAYRVDGDRPGHPELIDIDYPIRDMVLDPYNDVLYVVRKEHFNDHFVEIFSLTRPASPDEPLTPPTVLTRLTYDEEIPTWVEINPYRHRLYVVLSTIVDDGPSSTLLRIYDVSDPAQPNEVSGSPHPFWIKSIGIDAARDLLFSVETTTNDMLLRIVDVGGDQFNELEGSPPALKTLYPKVNAGQVGFTARYPRTDPFRNRVYMVRDQGWDSELIAFEYPDFVPPGTGAEGTRFLDKASYADFTKLDDGIDTSVDPDNRPALFRSYAAAVDYDSGNVFMAGADYNTPSSAAIMIGFDNELKLGDGCGDLDGTGCFYQRYDSEGQPTSKRTGETAICVDRTHKVVVGASIDPYDEEGRGYLHLFKYDDDLVMQPWLGEDDGGGVANILAGRTSVDAVCH